MKKLASGFASVGACVLRRVGIIKFPPPRRFLKGRYSILGLVELSHFAPFGV